jgi:hypothetical protein
MNADAEVFVHSDPIPIGPDSGSFEVEERLPQNAKPGVDDTNQEHVEDLRNSNRYSRNNESRAKYDLPRATDEVLMNFGPRILAQPSRVWTRRERRGREPAHIATLNRLRDLMGKEVPFWSSLPFLARHHAPGTSELLSLAWHYYPPRAKLKAYVYDIYNDHAEQTEILVGNIENCMDFRKAVAFFTC